MYYDMVDLFFFFGGGVVSVMITNGNTQDIQVIHGCMLKFLTSIVIINYSRTLTIQI